MVTRLLRRAFLRWLLGWMKRNRDHLVLPDGTRLVRITEHERFLLIDVMKATSETDRVLGPEVDDG
jgi:hypothetical protein